MIEGVDKRVIVAVAAVGVISTVSLVALIALMPKKRHRISEDRLKSLRYELETDHKNARRLITRDLFASLDEFLLLAERSERLGVEVVELDRKLGRAYLDDLSGHVDKLRPLVLSGKLKRARLKELDRAVTYYESDKMTAVWTVKGSAIRGAHGQGWTIRITVEGTAKDKGLGDSTGTKYLTLEERKQVALFVRRAFAKVLTPEPGYLKGRTRKSDGSPRGGDSLTLEVQLEFSTFQTQGWDGSAAGSGSFPSGCKIVAKRRSTKETKTWHVEDAVHSAESLNPNQGSGRPMFLDLYEVVLEQVCSRVAGAAQQDPLWGQK